MIQELLISAIYETATSNFVITEFQLGKNPMDILLDEIVGTGVKPTPVSVTQYMGIPVKEHLSKDAVMYSLEVNRLML